MMMNKMYTLGTHVEVVSDHQPLLPIYNTTSKPKNLRVDSHRIKLLPFNYSVVYEPGKTTPCDYGSQHPPKQAFSDAEIEEWCIDEGRDIYVNRLLEENLPQALPLEDLQSQTAKDSDLQRLLGLIRTRDKRSCKKICPESYGPL